MSDLIDAWLKSEAMSEVFGGYSAEEINAMDFKSFSRLRERAGLAPIEAPATALDPAPQAASQDQGETGEFIPPGIDVNSPEFFHNWRQNRASDGEGKGIFDSVGSRSQQFTEAVARQAGRTAYSVSNVEEPRRVERVYVNGTERDRLTQLYSRG